MSQVYRGRYTAQIEGSFVIFLIGMRVNRLLAVNKWLPVTRAMPAMLEELASNTDLGFLGYEIALQWRGVTLTQYWRSFEQLQSYAAARDRQHLPAWAAFNRAIGSDGSVGIWHETYAVESGAYECIYANMPRFGLGRVGEHSPVFGRSEWAKQRIGLE
jgi:hypothetical protein